MNVLIVGGGGRGHAIAWALSKSEQVEQLYCAPGNGGIAALAQCIPLSATDVDGVVAWAQTHSIDFVVVAPDDPLALGMVDALEDAGIPAFGPRADAAIIEASKIFSKNLMAKYHIPTAKYQTFTELAPALAYIEAEGAPIVVKADGLALGKGVIVAQTVAEAQEAARSMMDGRKFGQAGARVVIEECMTGPDDFAFPTVSSGDIGAASFSVSFKDFSPTSFREFSKDIGWASFLMSFECMGFITSRTLSNCTDSSSISSVKAARHPEKPSLLSNKFPSPFSARRTCDLSTSFTPSSSETM